MSQNLQLSPEDTERLIDATFEAQKRAYCPYSKFRVGAALIAEDGTLLSGCNVENASYGLSICAERTTLVKAVSEGHRKFKALAVICDMDENAKPCGACRQFMIEFGKYEVLLLKPDRSYRLTTSYDLLPDAFIPSHLEEPNHTH
eukprot:GILK01001690.1.p1 GENE.GILK01001690.1~~GILK01001690.1.p1  ORF type:complete len:159 (-),score=24.44 GILK01001690.1:1078-1512(-)